MPITKATTRTKCYLHEVQRPAELPYDRFQHHICWVCQSRLLELAKSNFRFELRQQVISISTQSQFLKEVA